MVKKRNAGRSRPMGGEIGKFTWETYLSLSTVPADVQGKFWSRNIPCFGGHALNCVFRYCLISLGDAVCGIVPSLYWSRAAAMCALSSFSELQNITRHRPKEEIKSLLKNHRIKQAQMSSKCPETTTRSRNMEAGLLFLLPYLRQALTGAFLTPHLDALSYIKKRLSQGYQYIPSTLLDILLPQINNGTF